MNRNPADLAAKEYDVIVVGAGIHGAAAAWSAARAGLRVALVDQADFGGGASANSLKIIHGGFRYLQHGNIRRMRESIRCRRRFMAWAPSLVRPCPFVVPTFGLGLRSSPIMRCALLINDVVASDRNAGLHPNARLDSGRTLTRKEMASIFPSALPDNTTGGALWYDAIADDTERLTLSFILDAVAHGASAANYAAVERILASNGKVAGVALRDGLTGKTHEVRGLAVVNASGTSIDALAGSHEQRRWIKAWNLIIDRQWFGGYGVGLEGKAAHVDPDAIVQRGKRNFFFAPWRTGTMIGTVYRHAPDATREPGLSDAEIVETLADINAVYPAAELRRSDVIMTHVGYLPGHPDPAMSHEVDKHSAVLDASRHGGPAGLFSIKGVKYTTGLEVGMLAATRAAEHAGRPCPAPPEVTCPLALLQPADASHAVKQEGAVHLADLIFRRDGSGSFRHPGKAALEEKAQAMGQILGWDARKRMEEIADVVRTYRLLGCSIS